MSGVSLTKQDDDGYLMGDGASTTRVLREHKAKKQLDDTVEVLKRIRELR